MNNKHTRAPNIELEVRLRNEIASEHGPPMTADRSASTVSAKAALARVNSLIQASLLVDYVHLRRALPTCKRRDANLSN